MRRNVPLVAIYNESSTASLGPRASRPPERCKDATHIEVELMLSPPYKLTPEKTRAGETLPVKT